jgi:beta-glucanase (GH16 family)
LLARLTLVLAVPQGFRTDLIDQDTPKSAMIKKGMGRNGNEDWRLQWSDEFNKDGRSFYPGDDPFWEAVSISLSSANVEQAISLSLQVDLYAHGTGDYEWYSPAAVTTKGGSLIITASEQPNHNLNFQSGHVTTWNKLCYTGGYLEASVVLPGSSSVSGWWPAIWTMVRGTGHSV